MLTQGFHGLWRWAALVLLGWASLPPAACATADGPTQPACPGPALNLQQLAPGVWRVPGLAGEADAANRGVVSNLLVVRDGARVWLLGAGPSPAVGRALGCQLKARTGWVVSDVIAPWPRPELVLGQSAFPAARLWAHDDVAAAMKERCPRCVARMRLRLAERAEDLGPDPIRSPTHRMAGDSGQLGPFLWWRLRRAEATAVTVFRLRTQPLWTAHGLLWGDGPPDLRDAEPPVMATAFGQLAQWARRDGSAARWVPEQGPLLAADAPRQHADYLAGLGAAVRAAQQRGALETDPPARWPGAEPVMFEGLRHDLNWQRAWHLMEDSSFEAPQAAPEAAAVSTAASAAPDR
jgi:hypothetical protein